MEVIYLCSSKINDRLVCQTGFLGLCGEKVDAIDFYAEKIRELDKRVSIISSAMVFLSDYILAFLTRCYIQISLTF